MTKEEKLALNEAIKKVNGISNLARIVGVKRQAVQQWLTNGIPYKRVRAVSKATGIAVTRLRKDYL